MRGRGVILSRVRVPRLPPWLALAIAALCFVLTVAVGCVPGIVAFITLMDLPEPSMPSDVNMVLLTAVFSCAVGVPVYFTTRHVYMVLRWKRVPDDGPTCATCGYNLTGNVSGRCPECGETI